MNSKKVSIKNSFIFLLLILIFFITGCNPSPQKPEPGKNNSSPELPAVLEEMEEKILQTMIDMDSIGGIEKAVSEKKQQELKAEAEKKQKKDKQPKQKIDVNMFIKQESILFPLLKTDEAEQKASDIKKPPDNISEIWFKINKDIESIHKQWNVLEPKLENAKISQASIKKFEGILTKSTENAIKQNRLEGLFNFNELTGYLSEFRANFRTKVPGEVYKMKYLTRYSVLLSSQGEFEPALGQCDKIQEQGNTLKQRLHDKGAQDVVQRFEASLQDYRQQLEEKNFTLSQIKANIVIKNIRLMEEAF